MPRSLEIAAGEPADQRDVHAAHEADLVTARRHRGEGTDEKRALVLLEHDGLHIREIDDHIDDGEAHVRKLGGDLLDGGSVREPHCDDRVGASLRQATHRLRALGFIRRLELAVSNARRSAKALRARICRLIERFVELATHVVDHGRNRLGMYRRGQQGAKSDCAEQQSSHCLVLLR